MALSVANLLLQISGDPDDAQRALQAVSRDLALFGRETAEAEVDVDTTSAKAHLEELEAKLADFSADDHSTEVNVLIAKAQADIAVLQAELDRIDGENVTVDVDVRRGIVERISSLTGQIERLGKATEETASGGISDFLSGIGEASIGAGFFRTSLKTIAIAAPFVIAAIVAIIGQLAAVVASAASAAGGIGALAVAFGAVLVPGILLAVGAIAQFKDEFETAGTAAFALAGNFKDVWNTFQNATSGGANDVFQGLSDALRDIDPLVESLRPAFERLGAAGGDAFRQLGAQFSSPAWREFFVFVTDSLAKLTPLFTSSFGAFAKILANIAQAAMPFLIAGFKALASGLEAIADKTSDIESLRSTIGGMVDSLGAWGDLLGGIVDLVGAFVEAFAPFGDSIVESLAEGAHNLADWLRSKEGMEQLQTFFEETGPLAAELGELLLNLGKIFVQVGQFFAPLATAVLMGLNEIAEAVSDVIDWMRRVDRALAFNKWGDAFSGMAEGIGAGLSAAFGAAMAIVRSFADEVVETVHRRIDQAKAAGRAIFNGVRAGFAAVRGAAVSVVRNFADEVVDTVRRRVGQATAAGKAIFNAVRTGFNAVRGAVVSVARGIAQATVAAVRAVVGAARSAGQAIMNAVQGGFNAVRGAVVDAARAIGTTAVNAVKALVGAAEAAGRAIGNGIASGLRAAISAAVGAARAIWDAINAALPDITLNIDIPTPNVPHIDVPGFASGVRGRASSGLSLVGEEGPELRFVPSGADIFTAMETRRILRALAGGVAQPFVGGAGSAPALAGGDGTVIGEQSFHFNTPGTGNPDPQIAMAQAALIQRQKGRRSG